MTSRHQPDIKHSQNFLRDPALVDHLVRGAGLRPTDLVYEVGPGRGIITARLAESCRHVLAVEKDPTLVRELRRRFKDTRNVEVQLGDVLANTLPAEPYRVFASVPFNITTAVVAKLTGGPNAPTSAHLILQKEAAERFAGAPRETLYSALLRPWWEPAITHNLSREDFVPIPEVDIVMLRLTKRGPPLIAAEDAQLYRDLVVYLFTRWQPSLRGALRGLLGPDLGGRVAASLGLGRDVTPAGVPFERWVALFHAFRLLAGPEARGRVRGAERELRAQQARLPRVHRTRRRGAPGPTAPRGER
jgi:16S rRNA A1518/A1519 N6-dimethyltransferase RsmA/KsgA/DIM1 with predicted DNA glycosylase/AP lyase activity